MTYEWKFHFHHCVWEDSLLPLKAIMNVTLLLHLNIVEEDGGILCLKTYSQESRNVMLQGIFLDEEHFMYTLH
jgi:hypothetical protein